MIRSRIKANMNAFAALLTAAVALGALYGAVVTPEVWVGIMGGALTGLLVVGGLLGLEFLVFTRRAGRRLTRRPFWQLLAIKLAAYLAVTLLGVKLGHLTANVFLPPLHRHGIDISLADVTLSLSVALMFVLLGHLDRQLGGRVLLGLLFRRYVQPRREERVFLLADLAGSTALAERIGDERFHAFLNDVFTDLAESVARCRGSIYRYVGDEVIVTWPLAEGLRRQRALRCTLDIDQKLRGRGECYRSAYGTAPRLHYALHVGAVVSGEMGELKREVVFLGGTMNTAARILDTAKRADQHLVISSGLLARLTLPEDLSAQPLLEGRLCGKQRDIALYALVPRT